MRRLILPSALGLLVVGCGDDTVSGTDMAQKTQDMAKTQDLAMAADMVTLPDMAPPAAPMIGAQIDRMGRPTLNVAVTNPFDLAEPNGDRDMTRDKYNQDSDPTKWQANWSAQLQINIAAYDGVDTVCGNQLLACGMPAGCGNTAPAAGRYKAFADVLADDRLYMDTSQTTCQLYLGVEAAALGLPVNDCGGRTPTANEDAVDETYTFAAVGLSGFANGMFAVTDGASDMDGTNVSLTTFPFLDVPN